MSSTRFTMSQLKNLKITFHFFFARWLSFKMKSVKTCLPSIFPIEFEGISGKEKSRIKEIDDKSWFVVSFSRTVNKYVVPKKTVKLFPKLEFFLIGIQSSHWYWNASSNTYNTLETDCSQCNVMSLRYLCVCHMDYCSIHSRSTMQRCHRPIQ